MFGDDAGGIRTVSRVAADLAEDGLEPLVAVEDQLDGLLPQDGAVPVDGVSGLEGTVAQAEDALITAEADLAAEDSSGYTAGRSEEHTSELQSLMRISYAVFCLKKKNK